MKTRLFHFFKGASLLVAAVVILAGVGYVFAAPSTAPSEGVGVSLPLNVGSDPQTKAGDLTVNGTLTAGNLTTSGTLNVSEICLNGDCQTEWPSGGAMASGTLTGGAGFPTITDTNSYFYGYYCRSNYLYGQMQYYYYGNSYNQYAYYCYNKAFSVVMPSNLPSGSTIISLTSTPVVWCHGGWNDYRGYGANYINDSYYPYRRQASNVSIRQEGANLVVSGNCTFGFFNGYVFFAIRLEGGVTVLYSS